MKVFRFAALFLLACWAFPQPAVPAAAAAAGSSPIRIAAGGSVRLPLTALAGKAASQGVKLEARTYPAGQRHISVGKSEEQGFFLAVPPTMPPGAYSVAISLAHEFGDAHLSTIDVVIEPLPPVPQTGRPPVVLVNGFDTGIVFGQECALSEDTTGTFGLLEELLTADGAPVVFFDNCRFGAPPIEALGQELGNVIAMLEHDDGSPVEQVDLVGFSMGALVVRSYLAGKQVEPGSFAPPLNPKVRKVVLVAGEHFGAPLAQAVEVGEQLPELRPASQFLWDLATWHQGFDDLRELDAIAVAGTGARDAKGDGVAPLTGASLSSTVFFGTTVERTRILPACHNGQARILCNVNEVMVRVDSEEHPTGRIIRSFLAGTDDWRQIGDAPGQNELLAANGGVHFALKNEIDEFVDDIERVVLARPRGDDPRPDVELTKGQANIFFVDSAPILSYTARVERPAGNLDFPVEVHPLGTTALMAKLGPFITRVQPAAGAVNTLSVAADSLVSIFGNELAEAEETALSLPLTTELAGTSVLVNGEPLGLLYVGPTQINAYLPAGLTGLVRFTVMNPAGQHSVNVLLDAAVPASFAADGSGQGPAAALHAQSFQRITQQNPTAPGGLVSLFLTGLGPLVESRGFQVAAIPPLVFVGGKPARVIFAGSSGEFVGLNQINIEMPADTPVGDAVPVVVRSAAREANVVTLAVGP